MVKKQAINTSTRLPYFELLRKNTRFIPVELSLQAYFYLEVWSLFGLLGLFLWRPFDLVLLLVSLQPPELLLNSPALFPHLLSVLLVKQGELSSASTNTAFLFDHTFTYKTKINLVSYCIIIGATDHFESPHLLYKH